MKFDDYLRNKKVDNNNVDVAFDLGNLIIEARLYSGITQKELADRLETKQPSIARAERGDVEVSVSFLKKVADAVDTKLILPKFGFMEDWKASNFIISDMDFNHKKYENTAYYLENNGDLKQNDIGLLELATN